MKTQIQKLLIVAAIATLTLNVAFADDLNPPAYRGDPLSVHVHWKTDATGIFSLFQFSSVDDTDPSTNLVSFPPTYVFDPAAGVADLRIPNFIDQEPIKYLRLQLTWEGTTQPPISVFSHGWEAINQVPGQITFASNPLVFTQPDGGYQYFDIEYMPNPDFEEIHINLPPDATITQVVVDSVSTIPEPATLMLLGLGALSLRTRK